MEHKQFAEVTYLAEDGVHADMVELKDAGKLLIEPKLQICHICQSQTYNMIRIASETLDIKICYKCYKLIKTAILSELLTSLDADILTDLISWLEPYKIPRQKTVEIPV